MKTPWRLFIDMASGRKSAASEQALPETAAKPTKPVSIADPQPTQATPDAAAETLHQTNEILVVRDEPSPSASQPSDETSELVSLANDGRDDTDTTDVDAPAVHPAIAAEAEIVSAITPQVLEVAKGRSKPSTRRLEPSVAVGSNEKQSIEKAPLRASGFFEDAIDLDAEIGAMRAALAEKLKQQNAQLRKMLERFSVS